MLYLVLRGFCATNALTREDMPHAQQLIITLIIYIWSLSIDSVPFEAEQNPNYTEAEEKSISQYQYQKWCSFPGPGNLSIKV